MKHILRKKLKEYWKAIGQIAFDYIVKLEKEIDELKKKSDESNKKEIINENIRITLQRF